MNCLLLPNPFKTLLLGLMLLAVLLPLAARAETPVDLAAALEAALARGESDPAGSAAAPGGLEGSTWLAAPPVLAGTYLVSDQPWGTDETEISLTLPFFSPEQRRINADLRDSSPSMKAASERYRAWRLSGVLRDLFARHTRARQERKLALTERDELDALLVSAEAMKAAGSLTTFDLWLIAERRREARAAVARLEAHIEAQRQTFEALTGFGELPPTGEPSRPPPTGPAYHGHPEYLWMEAVLEQQLASIRAGSNRLTPWTVGVIGRELAVPQLQEWQVGLEVSVPLSFAGRETPATRSSETAARYQFDLQRDAWRLDLRDRWTRLISRRAALVAERALLADEDVKDAVALNLDVVRRDTEMPIENRVMRRLELLRAAARPELLDADIAAVDAGLRQLAGEGL